MSTPQNLSVPGSQAKVTAAADANPSPDLKTEAIPVGPGMSPDEIRRGVASHPGNPSLMTKQIFDQFNQPPAQAAGNPAPQNQGAVQAQNQGNAASPAPQPLTQPQVAIKQENQPDVKQTQLAPVHAIQVDSTNDGKFSFWNFTKNVVSGFIAPLKQAVWPPSNALKTAGVVVGLGVACLAFPVAAPAVIGWGLIAGSAFFAGKSALSAANKFHRASETGNWDIAEQAGTDIGQGIFESLPLIGRIAKGAQLSKIATEASAGLREGGFVPQARALTRLDMRMAEAVNTPAGKAAALYNSAKEVKVLGPTIKAGEYAAVKAVNVSKPIVGGALKYTKSAVEGTVNMTKSAYQAVKSSGLKAQAGSEVAAEATQTAEAVKEASRVSKVAGKVAAELAAGAKRIKKPAAYTAPFIPAASKIAGGVDFTEQQTEETMKKVKDLLAVE